MAKKAFRNRIGILLVRNSPVAVDSRDGGSGWDQSVLSWLGSSRLTPERVTKNAACLGPTTV